MSKNTKISLFFILFCLNTTVNAEIVKRWQDVTGKFKLEHSTKEDAMKPKTVVSNLLHINGMDINNALTEDGKHVHYFSVTYKAPVMLDGKKKSKRLKTITQYGLYRTLDPELRTALKSHTTPLLMTIRYDIDNPTSFEFVLNNVLYSSPPMVSM